MKQTWNALMKIHIFLAWIASRLRSKILLLKIIIMTATALTSVMLKPVAWASDSEQRIIARANDAIVTEYDLKARSHLILVSSDTPINDQTLAEVRSVALRQLIDETLQIAEAERYDITAFPQDVENALMQIAQQNDLPDVQALTESLKNEGSDVDTLRRQLTAQFAWRDYVSFMYQDNVDISDEVIESELAKYENQNTEKQIHLFEIFLPINELSEEQQVISDIRTIERLLNQGAKFSSLARTFSKSQSAQQGGDLGWITVSQVSDNIRDVIEQMEQDSYSQPIRLREGVLLFYAQETRLGQTEVIPTYDEMQQKLFTEQMLRLSSRALRDLRKSAFIEYRE